MKANRLTWLLLLLLLCNAAAQHLTHTWETTSAATNEWPPTAKSPVVNKTPSIAEIKAKAETGDAAAQSELGLCYVNGEGVDKDAAEGVKWFQKAANQGNAVAQYNLGFCYIRGEGATKDTVEGVKLFRKAADQGNAMAQFSLGLSYMRGRGVAPDPIKAHQWLNLASAQGYEGAKLWLRMLEGQMTAEQIAEAERFGREYKPPEVPKSGASVSGKGILDSGPSAGGTGFFISDDGYLVTNEHVVRDATQVRLVTSAGFISAKVVKVDSANDLGLLKAEGRFAPLPVAPSRSVKLGSTVATVGFPNIALQGFAPKFARGEIASLSGAGDDARYFQISVPVQPGNSGGALVDERGNVVGVVSAKLDAAVALKASGALPENVNYAVKSSYLLSFLKSVPDVANKLKEPESKDQKFEDVVKSVEQAAVLVLVY